MAFGRKKDPIVELERERNELVARRDVLEQKFDRAHAALAAATNERRTSLLDADLSDEEACRRRDQLCRDAKDRVEALGDAISQIGSKIADMEAKVAELRAEAEKQEHARAVRHIADRLETETAALADDGAKIVPLAQELATMMPGVADHFVPGVGELVTALPATLRQFVGEARAYIAQLESGNVQLHRPASPAPQPEPTVQVERLRVYCLSSPIKWRERDQVICSGRYSFCDPPRDVAELALTRGLVALPDAEITLRTIEGFGANHAVVSPEMCLDLTALDQPATEPPTSALPPGFVETVGQPRQVLIDAGRVG